MKKVLLLAFVGLLGFSGFSQGEIKNMSYFNLAYDRPIRNYGENVTLDLPMNKFKYIQGIDGSVHYGGNIEFGTTFYIHPTGFIDGFKLGVLVDFIDLGGNYFKFNEEETIIVSGKEVSDPDYDATSDTWSDLNIRYSLNIGLIATVSPKKNFYIDVYGKVRPTFGVHWFKYPMRWDAVNDIYYSDVPPNVTYTSNQARENQMKEDTGMGFGFNSSFGLQVRYSKVSLGGEFIFGKINFKYDRPSLDKKVYEQMLRVKFGFFFSE